MGAALTGSAPILDEALALSRQGLPCFPCSSRKNPTTPHGYKDATRDPDVLRELWHRHPGPLIGVVTGETSGLNVLDIDARHGGAAWFARHRSDLPSTRVHRSRSGGLHLLFQYQAGVGCSAGRIAAGVDVRGSGGYAIWWPAAGLPVLSDLLPAAWPEWLLSFVSPPVRPASPIIRVPDDHTLMKIVRLIAYARPGERNNLTYWAACRAGEMVASGMLRPDDAAALITEAACRAGLSLPEAKRTAWSGIRASAGGAHG